MLSCNLSSAQHSFCCPTGKEVTAATDPVGSRLLEVLLPLSTAEAVLDFAQAVLTKHSDLEVANRSAPWNLDEETYKIVPHMQLSSASFVSKHLPPSAALAGPELQKNCLTAWRLLWRKVAATPSMQPIRLALGMSER